MRIVPIFLDARPDYFGRESTASSQLLCPAPEAGLIAELARSVRAVTTHAPYVLPTFTTDSHYEALVREQCGTLDAVLDVDKFRALIDRLDVGDALLLVSPGFVPAAGLDLTALVATPSNQAMMVRHLLTFDASSLRTKEFVQMGAENRVRRIQRYFEPVTWPFPLGVMASLVPVACFQMTENISLDTLMALRQELTARGLPSQDIAFHGECFDLNDEGGALALTEARLLARHGPQALGASAAPSPVGSAWVHETARVVGVVILGPGVVVEANALIVGPSVIGANARVMEGAIVAQCLVLPNAAIEARATVRHRVVVVRTKMGEPRQVSTGQRRHSVSGGQRQPPTPSNHVWRPSYLQVKYAVEPVLAFAALVCLAPLLLLLTALVRVSSSGPVFYGDRREGKSGRPFRCWKFRTMLVNADDMQRELRAQQQMDGPQFKMAHDPRVTGLGRWLRRLNLDELPQLWNVVCGQMSFVGPRPSPFRENQICVPWRHGRLSVRPGITGLWQVCRHDRALADFHQWIHYDLQYVRNVSAAVDARIFAFTILTLGGRYPVSLDRVIRPTVSDPTPPTLPTVRIDPVVVPSTIFGVTVVSAPHSHRTRQTELNAVGS